MKPAIKSEFKKLLTIRSTYLISVIALLLVGFLSFWVWGHNISGKDLSSNLYLSGTLTQVADTISIFAALISLLLLAHEYRYNTIVYTLTASNSRSKVLASKIIAILVFVFIFSLILTILALGLLKAGLVAGGHSLAHQDINYLTYVAKSIYFSEGFGMAGLLFAALIRNQVGAIAALFILPNTIEGLLSLLLKHNSVYMPFTALQQVIQPPVLAGARGMHGDLANRGYLSAPRGALVFLAYIAGGWIIAWYLFLRRDAS